MSKQLTTQNSKPTPSSATSKAPTPQPIPTIPAFAPNVTPNNPNAVMGSTANEQTNSLAEIPQGSVLLAIKIGKGSNIRGAKGEKVNSFLRVQMSDFDFKESLIVPETSAPDYNFSHDQILHVDESLVDIIANKKLAITLIESLPKEKTQVLGTAEISLSQFIKYPARDPNAPPSVPYLRPNLFLKDNISISYLNPKLLPPPSKEGDPNNQPEIAIEVSLSSPLISPELVEQGNFLYIKLEDMFPVPDEWTLKDGNEKDLNSNLYSYVISFSIPAESVSERIVTIPAGTLLHCEAVIPDTPILGAQPIYAIKPTDQLITSDGAQALDSETIDGFNANTLSIGAPTLIVIENPSISAETKQNFKKVAWAPSVANPYIVWIPPEAVVRLREKIVGKYSLDIEFGREMQPKFAHITDPNSVKYKGKAAIDVSCLMYPRVTGLRGRFLLDLCCDGSPNSDIATSTDHGTTKSGKKGKEDVSHIGKKKFSDKND
ncbi:Cilia- and flagella-associated protein 70 [Physocladia obscura]|uniref:Cilia- and flagella-associated protein 70 n=1 Tax=Physocladia obscura TaxID=109957 RepID=A0AAD5XHH2_9FUNG|nr:Cilia- and flagella-associated protein 70 [Physocladia obscura]